jgi:hypothetical protein
VSEVIKGQHMTLTLKGIVCLHQCSIVYIPTQFKRNGYINKYVITILLNYVICSDLTQNNLALRVAFCEQFGAERVKELNKTCIPHYYYNRANMYNFVELLTTDNVNTIRK